MSPAASIPDPWDVARAESFAPRSERMQDPVSIAAE
jgi:hypothetical protein